MIFQGMPNGQERKMSRRARDIDFTFMLLCVLRSHCSFYCLYQHPIYVMYNVLQLSGYIPSKNPSADHRINTADMELSFSKHEC